MRSSREVRASGCQCQSRNSPGFDPSILRHSGICGAADEVVLNTIHRKKKIQKTSVCMFFSRFSKGSSRFLKIFLRKILKRPFERFPERSSLGRSTVLRNFSRASTVILDGLRLPGCCDSPRWSRREPLRLPSAGTHPHPSLAPIARPRIQQTIFRDKSKIPCY